MGLGALRPLAWAAPGSKSDDPRVRPAAPAAVVLRNWRRDRARFRAWKGNDLRNIVILLRNGAKIESATLLFLPGGWSEGRIHSVEHSFLGTRPGWIRIFTLPKRKPLPPCGTHRHLAF